MIVIALIAVVGTLCWLLFNLTVYAVPIFVGLSAGLFAHQTGAGLLGATVVGFMAAVVTLVVVQHLFANTRSRALRRALGFAFAAPAAFAGYQAVFGVAAMGDMTDIWRQILAGVGAVIVAGAAWRRISAFAPHEPVSASRT